MMCGLCHHVVVLANVMKFLFLVKIKITLNIAAVCPPGFKRNTTTNNTCDGCPLNQYQPMSGQVSCILCGGGNITLNVNSTAATDCVGQY